MRIILLVLEHHFYLEMIRIGLLEHLKDHVVTRKVKVINYLGAIPLNSKQLLRRDVNLAEVNHDLLTNKYTRVFHEDEDKILFNAPHHFKVEDNDGNILTIIDFQEGPIKEKGVNGVANEDLLVMVLTRLEGFQNSEFRCRENALAITAIEEALLWLRKRTLGREKRGVEGTHIK
jgi:hypothetical protein